WRPSSSRRSSASWRICAGSARRSSWSSRTPPRRWKSPTTPTCWSSGRTATRARATSSGTTSACAGFTWGGNAPSGRQAPGDPEAARAVGREHDQLAGSRLDSGERLNDRTVRDEHEIPSGGPPAGDLAQRAQLLGLARAVVEEVAERCPDLCTAEA